MERYQAIVGIQRLNARIALPRIESEGAAGMDLRAFLELPLVLQPFQRCLVPTGLVFEIPLGFEGQVRPRSGLAFKHGVTVLNAPGTIDSDYRGELQVLLINGGQEPFTIYDGDRIAQLVISPVVQALVTEKASLSQTVRGTGGFGSTGM